MEELRSAAEKIGFVFDTGAGNYDEDLLFFFLSHIFEPKTRKSSEGGKN